ncbi:MAG: hypothetical protein M3N18_12950 [Actinomycetota bacterium]|nr:hypothetical protein [Actinomycetota bacterium]
MKTFEVLTWPAGPPEKRLLRERVVFLADRGRRGYELLPKRGRRTRLRFDNVRRFA